MNPLRRLRKRRNAHRRKRQARRQRRRFERELMDALSKPLPPELWGPPGNEWP